MIYLSEEPISFTIKKGLILYLLYDSSQSKPAFRFLTDMRTFKKSIDVKSLPKALTKRMVPPLCRSHISEIYDESYKFVQIMVFIDGEKSALSFEH